MRRNRRRDGSAAFERKENPATPAGAAILATGLFDPWYYLLQAREELTEHEAADHFLRRGADRGLLPNGLTDFTSVADVPGALADVLVSGAAADLPLRDLGDLVVPDLEDHARTGGTAAALLAARDAGLAEADTFWRKFVRRRERLAASLWTVLSSGCFDRRLYEAQTGRRFLSNRQAVWHYLEVGEPAGLLPNVVFVPTWYRSHSVAFRGSSFARFLRSTDARTAGPQLELSGLRRGPAETAGHVLRRWLEDADDGTSTVPMPGSGIQPTTVGELRRLIEAPLEDARRADSETVSARTDATRPVASLLLTCDRDAWRVLNTTLEARGSLPDGAEVVVACPHDEHVPLLTSVFAADHLVQLVRTAGDRTVALNTALTRARSERIVTLDSTMLLPRGWMPALTAAWSDEPGVAGVRPVVLTRSRTISSAGSVPVALGRLPAPVLAGYPADDSWRVAGLRFQAACGGVLGLRRRDVLDAGGFVGPAGDVLADLDLTLRIFERTGGRFATVSDLLVVEPDDRHAAALHDERIDDFCENWAGRWTVAGNDFWSRLDLEPLDTGQPSEASRRAPFTPVLARRPRLVTGGPAAGLPSLRWSLKIVAPASPRGDEWGDTFFAEDLAAALRRLGQEVVIDRREAHVRPDSGQLDDVSLFLRGLTASAPLPPGPTTSILWVISHPHDVAREELEGADLVYAASATWSHRMTQETGRLVRPLLQAVAPARFRPDGDRLVTAPVIFVGRTRQVFRPIVRDALAAGADIALFGSGWEQFVDPMYVRAEHLDNVSVPAAYRGADIVLNDHWDDMAQEGFYSNRLFDAVACGARVVSDEVEGVVDVLGPSVQTYRTVDDLRVLLDPTAPCWPDAAGLRANAVRVAAEHSFDRRARQLLDDVLALRQERGVGWGRGALEVTTGP